MLRLVPCHSDRFGIILSKKYEFVLPTKGQFMSLPLNFDHQIHKYFLWVEKIYYKDSAIITFDHEKHW